ncbi:10569_t:CDS:2, partial [Paraglomus occultum]
RYLLTHDPVSCEYAIEVIKFGNLPRNDTKNFICLSYLGSGAEAKSVRPISPWSNQQELTTSQIQKKNAEAAEHQIARNRLQAEANHWKTLWGIDAQVKTIKGQPALVMPYFRMCTHNELENDPQVKAAVVDAVKLMSSKGLKHNDLSRRHVGLYRKKKNGKLQAVFIDLSNVVREQEIDAVADMMEKLNLTE